MADQVEYTCDNAQVPKVQAPSPHLQGEVLQVVNKTGYLSLLSISVSIQQNKENILY